MPKGQVTWITYAGERRSIAAWERHLGLGQHTLWNRLHRGWSVDEALTTPGAVPGLRPPVPSTGIAPHIDGPAIASGGHWVPVAAWTQRREETP